MAGKGAAVVEQLVQFFFKCLETQAADNEQVCCNIHIIGAYLQFINDFQLSQNMKLYLEIIL